VTKKADKIELLVDDQGPHTLLVDGQEFPWDIARENLVVRTGSDIEVPHITLSIMADQVEVRYEQLVPKYEEVSEPLPAKVVVPWSIVGDRIELNEDAAAPNSNVLALKAVEGSAVSDEGGPNYLVRQSPNIWCWGSDPDDTANFWGPHRWGEVVAAFPNAVLEVVKVTER
jgi:hypothetical protein